MLSNLIFLLIGDYTSDAAFWIGNISFVAGNKVHVNMKNGLSGGFIYVYADVVTVGMKTLINFLLNILKHHIHCLTFMIGKVEIRCDMTLRNYQSMTR